MTLLPANLISDAVLLAHPYVSEYAVAPGSLLRALSSLDQEVMTLFSTSAPERNSFAASMLTVSVSGGSSNNLNGYSLVSGTNVYLDFRYVTRDGVVYHPPIRIVPENQFDNPPSHPAGIVRINTFWPCDPLNKRWAGSEQRSFFVGDGDKIAYRYVLGAVRMTSMAQALKSPDEAQDFIQWALAFRILSSHPLAPAERKQEALAQMQRAKGDLALMAMKRTETQGSTGSGA